MVVLECNVLAKVTGPLISKVRDHYWTLPVIGNSTRVHQLDVIRITPAYDVSHKLAVNQPDHEPGFALESFNPGPIKANRGQPVSIFQYNNVVDVLRDRG